MFASKVYTILLLSLALIPAVGGAQPVLSSSRIIEDQRIFGDLKSKSLFYYLPFGYRLATNSKGKPEFSLTQLRYTGTSSSGDAGVIKFNNRLQFRVVIDNADVLKLNSIKRALRQINSTAELRPLPVRKFSSVLVFAGTNATQPGDSLRFLKTGYDPTDQTTVDNNAYWTERIISMRLDNNDAQVVESAIRNRQSIVSFSYAIYSAFVEKDSITVTSSGNEKLKKEILDYFKTQVSSGQDTARKITLVKAEAFPLDVDYKLWPETIQKIDINERLPAKYPLFDVYCYDFDNELRPDLFAKKVEIKGTGVSGTEILTSFTFRSSRPEIYSKSIRFPYALRFDKPFFYRVTEITNDGDAIATEWLNKKDWSEIIDITTPADKVPAKKTVEED